MRSLIIHLKKLDWILVTCSLFLVLIGLLSIYSSSNFKGNFLNFRKQVIFLIISFFLMISLSFWDWRALRENSRFVLILYVICVLSLFGLFFFATAIRGTRSWYKIGLITIDPIEFTKIVLIIILAKYFSKRHIEMYRIRHIFVSSLYVLVPFLLIFFQPDLGSALLLVILWIGILIFSGIKTRHFLTLVLLFILVATFSWLFLLKDYQKMRILNFFQPQLEPLGMGWSKTQAKIAIGSGGFFGKGILKGSQVQLGFLPEPQTDFIFSAICEEMGLLGVGIILILFFILIWRVIKIAFSAKNNFQRLFASGFAILLLSQIFIHIGMNLGLLPIVGISLPLVSYGGSSLINNFIAFGILQSLIVNS